MMRYFRTADATLYEQVRATLDAAWGHPNADTVTCFDPAAVAPVDAEGRILLAVSDEFCAYEPVPSLLPSLLAAGVEEITAEEYVPVPRIPVP